MTASLRGGLVVVTMMEVGHVGMRMLDRRVIVLVRVTGPGLDSVVAMIVMTVVMTVIMHMSHRPVVMTMPVAFRQHERKTDGHDRAGSNLDRLHRLSEQCP